MYNDQDQGAYVSDEDTSQNQGAYTDPAGDMTEGSGSLPVVDTTVYIPVKIAPPSFGWTGGKEKTVIPSRAAMMKIASLSHKDSASPSLKEKNLLSELQGLFHANDGDSDGFLHRAELLVCLRMLGLPVTEKLVKKYLPVSFSAAQTAAERKNAAIKDRVGSGDGKARVSVDQFVSVTAAELAVAGSTPGTDGLYSSGAAMQRVQNDLELLLKRDVSDCAYDQHLSLRSLRHYLTEIVPKADAMSKSTNKSGAKSKSTLNRKEYNQFLRALGVLHDSHGDRNNAMLLASREMEFGLDYDALFRELLVVK
mgnify:CR=1 FL=1